MKQLTRRLSARKLARRERGATDPILVIAAIAVSLVLLVGGSFAVGGIISNGQNLNARGDLDKVATAQVAAQGALDTFFVYDSHRDSEYRALENGNATGGVGFTPTEGARIIVDVIDGEWLATSYSLTGNVYMRTSLSQETILIGTSSYVAAAGSGAYPMQVTDTTGAVYPAGFSVANVDDMISFIDADLPYPFAVAGGVGGAGSGGPGGTDIPGYGPPAGNAGGGSGGSGGSGGGGSALPAQPGLNVVSAGQMGAVDDFIVVHAGSMQYGSSPYSEAAPSLSAGQTLTSFDNVRAWIGSQSVSIDQTGWQLMASGSDIVILADNVTVGDGRNSTMRAFMDNGTLQFTIAGQANLFSISGFGNNGWSVYQDNSSDYSWPSVAPVKLDSSAYEDSGLWFMTSLEPNISVNSLDPSIFSTLPSLADGSWNANDYVCITNVSIALASGGTVNLPNTQDGVCQEFLYPSESGASDEFTMSGGYSLSLRGIPAGPTGQVTDYVGGTVSFTIGGQVHSVLIYPENVDYPFLAPELQF